MKEAGASVLEPHAGPSEFRTRASASSSGSASCRRRATSSWAAWTRRGGRHFYVRQLRDMKVSADLTRMGPKELNRYTEACGQVLAHAHARTGDPALIAGYLGKSPAFDRALTDFAVAYANQTDVDHAALQQAIADGKVEAQTGV